MNYFYEPLDLKTWNIFEETDLDVILKATLEMKVGDIVFLYIGNNTKQKKKGIYAIGKIISEPYILNKDEDYYNNKELVVDIELIKMETEKPLIPFEECKEEIMPYNGVHILDSKIGNKLYHMCLSNQTQNKLNRKIKEYIERNSLDEFQEKIEIDLKTRDALVDKFTIPFIQNMDYDDYVMGKADISEKGRESFCYLLERKLQNLGEARGANVTKFGFWYSKEQGQYEWNKSYGTTIEEAFSNLKQELISLITNGNNNNYEAINKSSIAPTVRSKILTTYFPEDYLGIFKEEDVDKFLNALEIHYDIYQYNTAEKKKLLLKKWKENHQLLKNVSDYYFVNFLYDTFQHELEIEHTVNGELDYDFEFVEFHYLGIHKGKKKKVIRPRDTDYEKMNRNKKDIGDRGETAVLNYEKKKLIEAGLKDLALKVEKNPNDAAGYDINSFDLNGQEIHIEVKTNAGNSSKIVGFYITNNELEKMKEDDKYYIYYLYNIKNKTKCHIINRNSLLEFEALFEPIAYKINLDVEVVS